MNKYATIEDYLQLYNAEIDDSKKERLIMLLDLASSLLREEARERGYNLEKMIERNGVSHVLALISQKIFMRHHRT